MSQETLKLRIYYASGQLHKEIPIDKIVFEGKRFTKGTGMYVVYLANNTHAVLEAAHLDEFYPSWRTLVCEAEEGEE